MDKDVIAYADEFKVELGNVSMDWWKSVGRERIPGWVEQLDLIVEWCKHIHPSDEPVLRLWGNSLKMWDNDLKGQDIELTVSSHVAGLISTLDIKLINHQNKKGSSYPKVILKEIYEN